VLLGKIKFSVKNHKFMNDKALILEKINNPSLTLQQIAAGFGVSLRTLYRRMEEEGIEHGRPRGRKKGQRKPLKTFDEDNSK
jgi:DNA invertase Pin-like site-specific DNA recombinase